MKNILKHKNKIIVSTLILAVLAFVFWWGGNAPSLRGWNVNKTDKTIQTEASAQQASQSHNDIQKAEEKNEGYSQELSENNVKYPNHKETENDKETGKDEYQTNPVPAGMPVPVEPQDTQVTDTALTCTISVRCDTILKNIQWFKEEKVNIIPKDGVIFAETEVAFYEGESVFNVTLREMKKNKIHFEFVNTPVYNSAYIEGIANLYEFDCGERSGWMYKVNGWFPNYGCSRYALKQGDKIEWVYTCDLGADVGDQSGFQKDE